MPLKPVGPLKRFRSEEISDSDEEPIKHPKKRSNLNTSRSKNVQPDKEKVKSATGDGDGCEEYLSPIVLRADSTSSGNNVVRGSSIKKAASLPSQNSDLLSKCPSPGQNLPLQKARKLARQELDVSMEDVARKLTANNHHDYEGVRVAKGTPGAEAETESLPFSFFVFFQTCTSKSDNANLSKKSLAGLWSFCIPFLKDLIMSGYFPQSMILHSVAFIGMKSYPNINVRNVCHDYLQSLLQHHPPKSHQLRKRYLHLFAMELKEETSYAWDGFSKILEDFLASSSPLDGDVKLVEYLVAVIEHDFHHWLDTCLKSGQRTDEPLISMIIWGDMDSGLVNYRVKQFIRLFSNSLEKSALHIAPFRRLLSVLAQMIAIEEHHQQTNSAKRLLVDYICQDLKSISSRMSSKKLYCQLYLMEPDWLSMEICRSFVGETCKKNVGIREVAVAVSQLKPSPMTNDGQTYEKVPRLRHFSTLTWGFLNRYINTFRLHAVKKRMKQEVSGSSEPLIELRYCYPHRILATKERSGYMYFASPETMAEDISTYWRLISKDGYFSSLLEIVCCESK